MSSINTERPFEPEVLANHLAWARGTSVFACLDAGVLVAFGGTLLIKQNVIGLPVGLLGVVFFVAHIFVQQKVEEMSRDLTVAWENRSRLLREAG